MNVSNKLGTLRYPQRHAVCIRKQRATAARATAQRCGPAGRSTHGQVTPVLPCTAYGCPRTFHGPCASAPPAPVNPTISGME